MQHIAFHIAFLDSIKLSEYRIGIKFDKESLAVEQNNCLTKNANVYIVYDLNPWSRILLTISNLRIAYLEQLLEWKIVIKKSMYIVDTE